jgi:hypothetical protein
MVGYLHVLAVAEDNCETVWPGSVGEKERFIWASHACCPFSRNDSQICVAWHALQDREVIPLREKNRWEEA